MSVNKLGNIKITNSDEHPYGLVTILDGEKLNGVVSAKLDLRGGQIPKAEIEIVCEDFDIEAKLIKADVTIVKNSLNELQILDRQLTWIKQYFETHPQDFDNFKAALVNNTYLGSEREDRSKFLNIFRSKPYNNIDYSIDQKD